MTATLDLDARAWPDLATVPRGPRTAVSAAVARRLFTAATARLGLTWSTDDPSADLVIHRPDELFARLGSDGLIGFGESYLTGAWDAADLGGTLTTMCAEIDALVPRWMQLLRAAYVARPPRHHRGSEQNTQSNIAHHYDLSNELFALFLDPTLSYSSALFDTDAVTHRRAPSPHTRMSAPRPGAALEEAQGRKVETILDAAGVTAGSRVLEIGTGWGELAIRAARRGAIVHSVTLSVEQRDLARRRVDRAAADEGWDPGLVSIELCDYRAVDGGYDAVVSVEMIEAVGFDYWPAYFETVDRVLAPGGRVAIQAITMPHERMLATRRTHTWINKYIFPGGFLPSTEAIDQVTREHTTLRLRHRVCFGSHYAETLRQWDEALMSRREEVLALGFDETFVRMWHFYLEYARAGFASGYLDVQQLTLTREDT